MSIESIEERADGHLEHYHCGGVYSVTCGNEGPRCTEDLRLLLAVATAARAFAGLVGIEFSDDRLHYEVAQIDRLAWRELAAALDALSAAQ